MRWIFVCIMSAILVAGGDGLRAAHPTPHQPEISLYGPAFSVGGLKFTVPSKWQSEPVENDNRAGQWHVPPPHGEEGEGGEVVVFYFGTGIGGSPRENADAWAGMMLDADGHPPTATINNHVENGIKIEQVALFGTYNRPIPLPGLPPQPKPKYGLIGAIIENTQGNIYWRFTGPEALVTANQPLFNKILASVKPRDK